MRGATGLQIIQDYASSGSVSRRAPQMAASMHITRSSEQQQPYPGSSPPISSGKSPIGAHASSKLIAYNSFMALGQLYLCMW